MQAEITLRFHLRGFNKFPGEEVGGKGDMPPDSLTWVCFLRCAFPVVSLYFDPPSFPKVWIHPCHLLQPKQMTIKLVA